MLTDNAITDWSQFLRPAGGKLAITLDIMVQEVAKRQAGDDTPLRIYIDGPTGAGKTTLARLIAHKMQGAIVKEVRSGERLCGADFDWLEGNSFCWRVMIVNEAQKITGRTADTIMGGLDGIGKRACVIFTTMEQSTKANPLFADYQQDRAITDRCFEVHLTTQGLKSPENVAKVLVMARESRLDYGANERAIENLFESEQNSIRGVLSAISRGALASI